MLIKKGCFITIKKICKTFFIAFIILFLSAYIIMLLKSLSVETNKTDTVTDTKYDTFTPETSEAQSVEQHSATSTAENQTEPNEKCSRFLLSIANPDSTYEGTPMDLSNSDREILSHVIMGESGSEGFIGCALLAQCIRDAMVNFKYSTVSESIENMQYSGWYSGQANQNVTDAVTYIFDQGNSAVQHRILVMYATDFCEGSWHETQQFIIQYNNVRFFDYWQ